MRLASVLALLLLAAPADARPTRIVSMNPCTDAILVAVADRTQLLAISHWSHDSRATSLPLAEAMRFRAHYGTAEEVIALQPDLVFLSPHTPLATRSALRRAGVRLVEVGVPASIAQSRAQVRLVADAAGQVARGEVQVAAMDAAVRASTRDGMAVPVLMRMGSGIVPGPGTLADDMLRTTGFRNSASGFGLAQWDMLSLERLAASPPRLILTDRPNSVHPVLARVAHAEFPARYLNCGGPTIVAAVARLADIRDTIR